MGLVVETVASIGHHPMQTVYHALRSVTGLYCPCSHKKGIVSLCHAAGEPVGLPFRRFSHGGHIVGEAGAESLWHHQHIGLGAKVGKSLLDHGVVGGGLFPSDVLLIEGYVQLVWHG